MPAPRNNRVVLYSHNSNLSGAPISLSLLAKELPRHGYDPLLVLPKPGPIERRLTQWGVDYRVLKRVDALWELRSIVRRADPLLVHVNTIMKSAPVLLVKMMRRPVVWHVREVMRDKYFDARMIHLIADWVILICDEQHRLFRRYDNVSVIPNGVEVSLFQNAAPVELPVRGKTTVAWVGSIQRRKGLLDVAKAAARLRDKPWIHFVVAGDTHPGDGYKQEILELIEDNGIRDRFTFLGHRDDVPEVLAASDLFCFPAYHEPFGRVVIEAMAAGLPVVATSVGEIPKMVAGGETGFLAEPGDVGAVAEAISTLDGDRDLLERFGKAALKKVREEFSLEGHTRKVTEVYERVAERRRKTSS
jgi:glycosyltransferase involved in cell wall biosynthesis